MKKILIISFLILVVFFAEAQVKNGKVVYAKINATSDTKNIPKEFLEKVEKVNAESNKIDYSLNFIEEESYFFANSVLFEDSKMFSTLVVLGYGKLKYYQNTKTKEYREFRDSKRTGKTIINNKENYEWILTNDTKIIDGYTCYKAITPIISPNGVKSTDPKFNIYAWYTPQIPVQLGPLGYGDLPGLILELQKPMVTFFVKSIKLNLETPPFIDKLTSMEAISLKELNQRAQSTLTKNELELIDQKNK